MTLGGGDSVGKLFEGRYHLKEELGAGGFATVYKAWQTDLGRDVAIKIYHSFVADDEGFVQRFMREAQSLNKVSHANVVGIYHIGTSNSGAPYMVMELLGSNNLRRLLNTSPPDNLLALRIIRDAARALDFVHQNGIVHRDLKPENIVFVDRPDPLTVKIIDFGLARDSKTENQKLTQTGELLGTPHYMSPEQCAGQKIDASSDIYSLGLVLYEALSGQKPFDGDNAIGILYKQMNDPVPLLSDSVIKKSSHAINQLLRKSTEKDPANRFKSMGEFADAIQKLMDEIESGVEEKRAFSLSPKILALAILLVIACAAAVLVPKLKSSKIVQKVDPSQAADIEYEKKLSQAMEGTNLRSKIVRLSYFIEKTLSEDEQHQRAFHRSAIIRHLDELLAQAKTEKSNRWIFLCLRLKARLLSYRHNLLQSMALNKEAIKYCKKPDGSLYFDAVDCYLQLNDMDCLISDEAAIRDSANRCIEICKNPSNETFDIPEQQRRYLTRPAIIDKCLASLARSYMRTGELDAALDCSKRVFESMNGIRGTLFRPYNYCDALIMKQQKKEAMKVAAKICRNLTEHKTSLTEREDFETLVQMGNWYLVNDCPDEAKRTYLSAIKYADDCNNNLLYGANAVHWKRETAKLRVFLSDPKTHYIQLCTEHASGYYLRFCMWKEAIAELNKVIKFDVPENYYFRWARLYLYIAVLHENGLDAARKTLEIPDDKRTVRDLAEMARLFLLDKIDKKTLLAAAKPEEYSQANFLIAEKLLASGKKDAARKYFMNVKEHGDQADFNFKLTLMELELLDSGRDWLKDIHD